MDRTEGNVEAVVRVLLELTNVLGEHRSNIVLVGGLVPRMLLGDEGTTHVGTTDLDLVVDHQAIRDDVYSTIADLLKSAGYTADNNSTFRFVRRVVVDGQEFEIPVDFLAGESGEADAKRRHQHAGGIMLRKLHGGDLVAIDPIEILLKGKLPDGALDSARIRVVRPCFFVVLKALAIAERMKPKDYYDLCFVLSSMRAEVNKLGAELARYKDHPAVAAAIETLREKFASVDHVGPKYAGEFLRARPGESADIARRDAYELVGILLGGFDAATQ